jgi:hypothetical protein
MIKDYHCTACGFNKQYFGHYADEGYEPIPVSCPECNGHSCRIVYRSRHEHKSDQCLVDVLERENTRWSLALGVQPCQVEEASKMHPGARFREDGAMEIRSRSDKLRRMKERSKATGQEWVEWTGKDYAKENKRRR